MEQVFKSLFLVFSCGVSRIKMHPRIIYPFQSFSQFTAYLIIYNIFSTMKHTYYSNYFWLMNCICWFVISCLSIINCIFKIQCYIPFGQLIAFKGVEEAHLMVSVCFPPHQKPFRIEFWVSRQGWENRYSSPTSIFTRAAADR
jgi:hypothetical protein